MKRINLKKNNFYKLKSTIANTIVTWTVSVTIPIGGYVTFNNMAKLMDFSLTLAYNLTRLTIKY